MKTKYDLVLGMGYACSCAQAVRAAGLQFASFPFDWAASLSSPSMSYHIDTICNDFANWFEKKDLVLLSQGDVAKWETSDADVYHNTRTDYFFPHAFAKGSDFDKAYEEVARTYRRRIDRLYALLRSAKRVLLVRMDSPALQYATTADECREAQSRLMAKFPGVAFDIIYLTMDRTRPFADRLEQKVSDGVLNVSFDYSCHRPNMPGYMTDVEQIVKVLRSHAKVRDYRTPEERREYVRKRHLERWSKLGATTFWGYQLARIRKAFSK